MRAPCTPSQIRGPQEPAWTTEMTEVTATALKRMPCGSTFDLTVQVQLKEGGIVRGNSIWRDTPIVISGLAADCATCSKEGGTESSECMMCTRSWVPGDIVVFLCLEKRDQREPIHAGPVATTYHCKYRPSMTSTACCMFAGIGGFACGMAAAGVTTVVATEAEVAVAEVMKRNQPECTILRQAVTAAEKATIIAKRPSVLAASWSGNKWAANDRSQGLDDRIHEPRIQQDFEEWFNVLALVPWEAVLVESAVIEKKADELEGAPTRQFQGMLERALSNLGFQTQMTVITHREFSPMNRTRWLLVATPKSWRACRFPELNGPALTFESAGFEFDKQYDETEESLALTHEEEYAYAHRDYMPEGQASRLLARLRWCPEVTHMWANATSECKCAEQGLELGDKLLKERKLSGALHETGGVRRHPKPRDVARLMLYPAITELHELPRTALAQLGDSVSPAHAAYVAWTYREARAAELLGGIEPFPDTIRRLRGCASFDGTISRQLKAFAISKRRWSAAEQLVEGVNIPPNSRRENVAPRPGVPVPSKTIGLVRARNGRFLLNDDWNATRNAFAAIARAAFEENGGPFDFTTVCINRDFACPPHRDANNDGLSRAVALGAFRGGRLLVWPRTERGDVKRAARARLPEMLNIHYKMAEFDGQCVHATEYYAGRRTSLILYCARGHAQADLELLQEIGLTRGHELDAVRVAAANEQVDIPRGGFLQRELEDGRGPEEERGREE